jgi:cell division protein FtsQ
MKSIKWKKRIEESLWLLFGLGSILLLGTAMRLKDQKLCSKIDVQISGSDREMFINEEDVRLLLNKNENIEGQPIKNIDLKALELFLKKNVWIKNAELYLDNNQMLNVKIVERIPVARVFTVNGNSFYLDSTGLKMPLSERLSLRVPVFTNFPSDKNILSFSDSSMLQCIVKLGKFISQDSFRMAQVSQIDILPNAEFEIVPSIGSQLIELGDTSDLDKKFIKLVTFYKQTLLENTVNNYSKIYLQYKGQVVAVKKDYQKTGIDSVNSNFIISVTGSKSNRNNSENGISHISNKIDSDAPAKNSKDENQYRSKQNKTAIKSLSYGRQGLKAKIITNTSNTVQPKALMKKEK